MSLICFTQTKTSLEYLAVSMSSRETAYRFSATGKSETLINKYDTAPVELIKITVRGQTRIQKAMPVCAEFGYVAVSVVECTLANLCYEARSAKQSVGACSTIRSTVCARESR